MTDADRVTAALRPTTDALVRQAREAARVEIAAAEAEVGRLLTEAHEAAAELREQARWRGAANAEAVTRTDRARVRRDGRGRTLRAQRETLDAARAAALDLSLSLTRDPRWPQVQDALRIVAAKLAGPDAVATEHPLGGIVATGHGVIVDLSLPALATTAFDDVCGRAERLWA